MAKRIKKIPAPAGNRTPVVQPIAQSPHSLSTPASLDKYPYALFTCEAENENIMEKSCLSMGPNVAFPKPRDGLRRNFGSEVYTKSCMRNFISALYSNNII
jgi:hypothetical protein